MQKHFFKFRKVFTNFACSPLLLILNNSELAAKFLPNDVEKSINNLEVNKIKNVLFQGVDIKLGGQDESEKEKVKKLGGLFVIGTEEWKVGE